MDCTAWPRLHLLEIAWGLILFPMCRRFWNRSGGYVPCLFGIILWGKKSRSTYSIIQLWKCVLSLFGSSFWVRGWFLCFRFQALSFNWTISHRQNALLSGEVMQMERNVKYEALNSEHILSFGVKYMNWQEYVAIYSCYLEGRVSKQPRLEFAVFVFFLCHCAFVPRMLDSYNTKKPHRTRERWKPKWFN